jgi:hypothetical protein
MIVLCKKSPINVVMMGKKSQALVSGNFFLPRYCGVELAR